ncbi:ABC transporter substrate-binding protein [Streptomyces sp. HNM0575]|uniref:ABC transporter substrate-binding protein n=1 Tax=Streptomyces sp. HNM0575 TaxID=2716338 RepID=UPI00145F9B4E|nr:ABC transporter substrate-binding protein [Streptomyces sp. HNM0575]NLU72691.1 ABC transporter substrate-binding protein [Streptomyces sp. HNM0575]
MKRALWRCTALSVAGALMAACGGSAGGSLDRSQNKPATVRIGSEKVTADAGIFLADHLGYFRKAGIKVEYTRLKDAPAITNALATGHLEVAGASLAPGVFQGVDRGLDLRVVGDKQSIRPGVSSTRFAVKSEYKRSSLDKTLKALRGKKIAVHSKLSIQVYMLRNMLRRHGMSLKDFDIVPILSPDQIGALRGGSADAAVMLEPFFTQGIEAGLVKPASDLTEGTPRDGEVLTGLMYGKQFLEHRDTAQAFMTAYMQGVRAYNDALFHGKNKRKVLQVIAKESKMPVSLIEKTRPCALDPEQRLDAAYLNKLQKFYVKQGTLKKTVDVKKLIDTSFAKSADKKLGEYRAP